MGDELIQKYLQRRWLFVQCNSLLVYVFYLHLMLAIFFPLFLMIIDYKFYKGLIEAKSLLALAYFSPTIWMYPDFLIAFTSTGFYRLVVLVGAGCLLVVLIGPRLMEPKELASGFLDASVAEIEKLDVSTVDGRGKPLQNMDNFLEMVSQPSPLLNFRSVPWTFNPIYSIPTYGNNQTLRLLERKMQFIVKEMKKSIEVINLSMDYEKLKQEMDKIESFSTAIRERDYMNIPEAKLESFFKKVQKALGPVGFILKIIDWLEGSILTFLSVFYRR